MLLMKVDIAINNTSHTEREYPRKITEAKSTTYQKISDRTQQANWLQGHILHKVGEHMRSGRQSRVAEMANSDKHCQRAHARPRPSEDYSRRLFLAPRTS